MKRVTEASTLLHESHHAISREGDSRFRSALRFEQTSVRAAAFGTKQFLLKLELTSASGPVMNKQEAPLVEHARN